MTSSPLPSTLEELDLLLHFNHLLFIAGKPRHESEHARAKIDWLLDVRSHVAGVGTGGGIPFRRFPLTSPLLSSTMGPATRFPSQLTTSPQPQSPILS